MGQIIGSAAKPKRCNISKLSQLGTPSAGEHILVSSDNSMNAAGQGNFDCYIVGDGRMAATALPLIKTYANDVDDEPTDGSDNLVKSSGVYDDCIYYDKTPIEETSQTIFNGNRIRITYSNLQAVPSFFSAKSLNDNYQVSMGFFKDSLATNILNIDWRDDTGKIYKPNDANIVLIALRKKDNSSIAISELSNMEYSAYAPITQKEKIQQLNEIVEPVPAMEKKVDAISNVVSETFTVLPQETVVFNGNRVRMFFYPIPETFRISAHIVEEGYQFGLLVLDNYPFTSSSTKYYDSGWVTSFDELWVKKTYPNANCVLIMVRKTNNSTITINEGVAAISYTAEYTTTLRDDVNEIEESLEQIIPKQDGQHNYAGDKIILEKTENSYNLVNSSFIPLQAGYAQQGIAIYNDYILLGFEAQIEGGNKLSIGSMSGNSLIEANIALPHVGYGNLHCNSMNFGRFDTSTILPLLYVSQTINEQMCFVYNISDSYVASLKQTISCANVSSAYIGTYFKDYFVDTDNNFLYVVSSKENDIYLSLNNKTYITKFQLPAVSDAEVVLEDNDVLDTYEIPYHQVRQSGVIHNNKLYMLYGASAGGQLLSVVDLTLRKEVSVIDLSWAAVNPSNAMLEPEGIAIYNGDLVIRYLSNARNFKFEF